jgi:hypothetical protein
MMDTSELEVFGSADEIFRDGSLCCRWKIGYIREIHLNGNPLGGLAQPVKFDWLESTTKPAAAGRVKAALTINRGQSGFKSRVGGRDVDPWVPPNRGIVSLLDRLHPPKSEGRFFMRWGPSDGEGRLQFVEWFKQLLAKYQKHQIVIFDPYFEDVGLGLVLLCARTGSDMLIFRSLPKARDVTPEEPSEPSGLDNLILNCEQNRFLFGNSSSVSTALRLAVCTIAICW